MQKMQRRQNMKKKHTKNIQIQKKRKNAKNLTHFQKMLKNLIMQRDGKYAKKKQK